MDYGSLHEIIYNWLGAGYELFDFLSFQRIFFERPFMIRGHIQITMRASL